MKVVEFETKFSISKYNLLLQDDYEVNSFQISPRFDLLLNFFLLHRRYYVQAVVKNSFKGKSMETVFSYSFDMEVVEVGSE